jgi:hypothetical protein
MRNCEVLSKFRVKSGDEWRWLSQGDCYEFEDAKATTLIGRGMIREVSAMTMIERTLQKINENYEAGLIEWIKLNRPNEWNKIRTLEGRVNEMALRSDLSGLREALSEYQSLILAAVKAYKALKENKGQEMFNFVERPKSPWGGLEVGRVKKEVE